MCEHHAKQHRGGGRERQFAGDISAARARIDAKEAPSPDLREAERVDCLRNSMWFIDFTAVTRRRPPDLPGQPSGRPV
jgi:hypothetical protein